jgi:GNAT superfamily N-acetyltransferase
MAIHPYPIEMVAEVRSPMAFVARMADPAGRAEMERAFVAGLSEQTRYFRFFYQLHELTPAMLARFTQVDYDRELALVAVDESAGAPAIVGVARYIMGTDRESAEFAVVVADAWHGRGVGRALMARLVAFARSRGLKRLEGSVLRSNHNMLKFTAALDRSAREPRRPGTATVGSYSAEPDGYRMGGRAGARRKNSTLLLRRQRRGDEAAQGYTVVPLADDMPRVTDGLRNSLDGTGYRQQFRVEDGQ